MFLPLDEVELTVHDREKVYRSFAPLLTHYLWFDGPWTYKWKYTKENRLADISESGMYAAYFYKNGLAEGEQVLFIKSK
jgi:hypothetical protein